MNERLPNENIRWGLRWGLACAILVVVLGPLSTLLTGKLDALISFEGLILWLLGMPAACISGGLVVGLSRPLASKGVAGAMMVGAILGFVLVALVLLAELLIAGALSGEPNILIVGMMIVGGLLGGFATIFIRMLTGEPISWWNTSTCGDDSEML